MSAKDNLIGRMREQYAQIHGREPNGKVAREIEKKAADVAERVGRSNTTTRYQGR